MAIWMDSIGFIFATPLPCLPNYYFSSVTISHSQFSPLLISIMASTTKSTSTNNEYKDNLLRRIGGMSSLEFLVISYCTRIQDDASLQQFYGNCALKNLITIQKEFLMAALLKSSDEAQSKSRAAIRHYRLFELGLNETHFDALFNHFSGSLRDCWLASDVIEDCEKHFNSLRPVFQEHGSSMKQREIDSEDNHRRFSESMRIQKAIKDFDKLNSSEEFNLKDASFYSKHQSKSKSRTPRRSFLQTNKSRHV